MGQAKRARNRQRDLKRVETTVTDTDRGKEPGRESKSQLRLHPSIVSLLSELYLREREQLDQDD